MICSICKQYMNNNKEYIDYIFYLFSDALFCKTVKEATNYENEYFYMPDKLPSIWRCPTCKTIYWFEYRNNNSQMFLLDKNTHLIKYQNNYICTCGHKFLRKELIHCYPHYQKCELWEIIDDAFEQNLPGEFEDSKVHIWKCPDCNRLYWIERDSGIVQCYEKKE